MEDKTFQIFRLVHSSSNDVFKWLEENKPTKKTSRYGTGREELEKALIARNEPLINLGLALFGFEADTGITLFQKEDTTIKKAALAGTTIGSGLGNTWVENSGALSKLLYKFDKELLVSFIANENIKDSLLTDLYERKAPFDKLNDQKWYTLLWASIGNPRISTPYDDTWMDGFDEYLYGQVFSTAWKLFEVLPVDKESAALLAHLGEKLVPDKPHDMDVLAVIKRWHIEKKDEHVDYFELCRLFIAGLVKEFEEQFESFKDSDDIALRLSYYRRYTADKPEAVRELFEKDNDKFLDGALNNINLFQRAEIRDELCQCCWDYKDPRHDLLYPNIYNSRVECYTKGHPEWFKDWDGEMPLDKVEDPTSRANIQLNLLNERVKSISEKLIESKNEDQQPLIEEVRNLLIQTNLKNEDQQPLIDEVRNLLIQTNLYLSQLSGAKAPEWGGIIAGFIIGSIIAKIALSF